MIGFSIQDYAASVATIIFLVVKQIGGIVTLTTLVFMLMLYGWDMLDAVGSYAIGAQILFFL